jgi:hypothetical protein
MDESAQLRKRLMEIQQGYRQACNRGLEEVFSETHIQDLA